MQRPDVLNLPLFAEVADQLRNQGTYQKALTGQDVAGIMHGVAQSLVAGSDKVEATIASMSVNIENGQGRVAGKVDVEKPLKAAIGLNCSLVNDVVPGRIRLAQLSVEEKAGWLEKAALKIFNIRKRAENALQDPNVAFSKALVKQLEPRGVTLTDVQLQFAGASLAVSLKGRPTNP